MPSEIDNARANYGRLFRVVQDAETRFAETASLNKSGRYTLTTISTAAAADGERRSEVIHNRERDWRPLRRSNHAVVVYLDGRFLREADWRGDTALWSLELIIDEKSVEVRVQGTAEPPAELHLASTNGRHLPETLAAD